MTKRFTRVTKVRATRNYNSMLADMAAIKQEVDRLRLENEQLIKFNEELKKTNKELDERNGKYRVKIDTIKKFIANE